MAAPFISYLTVFKSRLGIANLVLGVTGLVHQPEAAVVRKLRALLEERRDLALRDVAAAYVFEYLLEKRLIGPTPRAKGRYTRYGLEKTHDGWIARDRAGKELREIAVYVTDIWLADHAVRSTIGVPTPDNVEEVLELAFQLRLLSRAKNTWTAAAQLIAALRVESISDRSSAENPFLLQLEAPALLRQIIATDGLIVRELVRILCEAPDNAVVRRDAVADRFREAVGRALEAAKEIRVSPRDLQELKAFNDLIDRSSRVNKRGDDRRQGGGVQKSAGPGVLEHRVSPRLEWLTDLGYLSKEGIQKNSFEYRITSQLRSLLTDLDGDVSSEYWPETVAVSQWWRNVLWAPTRAGIRTTSRSEAFSRAYALVHRRIGPAPLREVAFGSCLFARCDEPYLVALQDLVRFAGDTKGATLSGGTYRRSPENIYLPDAVWSDVSS